MWHTILIANRGEIACRIIRTTKRLGIRAVAVYSEVDEGAMHTRLADEALCIGPAAAAQSYLDQARIIDAARKAVRRQCIPATVSSRRTRNSRRPAQRPASCSWARRRTR